MWETWVQSLDREDPLEKEMATQWTEELGGLESTGRKESDTTSLSLSLSLSLSRHFIKVVEKPQSQSSSDFYHRDFVEMRCTHLGRGNCSHHNFVSVC